jgi:polar amino acid transport system substrate-binding protein
VNPTTRRLLEYLAVVVVSVVVAYALFTVIGPKAGGGTTGSVLDRVLSSGKLRAAAPVSGGLPIAGRDASGNITGWMPDMWSELAKSLKVNLEIIDTPGEARIPSIQAGTVDVAQGTITLERAQAVGFTLLPSDAGAQAGATLQSSGITAYDQIGSKKVGVVTGSNAELFIPTLFPQASVQHFADTATNVQALKSNQVDVVFDDAVSLAKAKADDPTITLLPAVKTEPGGLMAPLGDQKWINYLTYFVWDYYATGTTTCGCGIANWAKWYGAPPADKFQPNY